MSDIDDFDNQNADPANLRDRYEAEARARAQAEAELAQLRAESYFRDAGIDPAKPLHAAAMRGDDGDMSPDVVRNYVTELGLNTPAPAPAEQAPPPVPMDQQEALIRIAEAARDAGGMPQGAPDTVNRLRDEMQKAAYRGDNATLDRLSVELSRAQGYPTKWDADNRDEPSLPAGTPRMPVVTQPKQPFDSF